MINFEKIATMIMEKNDKINSKNSVDLYLSKIKKIIKDLDIKPKNLDFLDDISNITKTFEDKSISTRKNYLWSIFTVLKYGGGKETTQDEYLKLFNTIADEVNIEKNNGLKSKKQEANWVELKELRNILRTHEKHFKLGLKNDKLTPEGFNHLRQLMTGSLYIGDIANPPRRLADYAKMKIITRKDYDLLTEDDKANDNFLIKDKTKKEFSFGNYKTESKYGTLLIPVGKKLNLILNKYLKYHTSEFLLTTRTGKPLTSLELGNLLNKVFSSSGKKISVSMLRHIFLSETFGDVAKKQKAIASKMSHSVGTAINEYVVE